LLFEKKKDLTKKKEGWREERIIERWNFRIMHTDIGHE